MTALGHFNIDLSRNVLGVLLIGEVAIVLALDAAVIFTGGNEGLSTGIVTPAQIVSGATGIALLFAILSFIGFEATAMFRDGAREPLRTIPRATYLAVIVAVAILLGVLFKLDLVNQFYTWLAGISTVGITTLLIATSVAVLAFFARQRRAGQLDVSPWRAFVAPDSA